jgi:hypothetical protein
MSINEQMVSMPRGFYVQPGCCTSCGVPQKFAPDLVGWTNDVDQECVWIKQPETAAEFDQAIKVLQTQELGCHRYAGDDPALLQALPAEDCDHFRPDLKLNDKPILVGDGPAPNFALSVSAAPNAITRLWRRLFRR